MAQHIFKGVTAPTFPPRQVGHHYVDTVLKQTYVSVGTSAPSDWILLNSSSLMPELKAGRLLNSDFTGNPKRATVVFTTPSTSTDYAVNVSGVDARIFTIENKTINGFDINTHANLGLTGDVFWEVIEVGEFI